jgi:opacity protein-like surface antigen
MKEYQQMKILSILVIGALLTISLPAKGATLSAAGSRETLLEQGDLDFLTIGADYQQQQRDVSTSSQGKVKLRSQMIDGYVGIDPYDWLMIFATAGGAAAKMNETEDYNDPKFKWSAGFNLNLWHFDLQDPTFMAGRLSLRTHAEFGMYSSGSDADQAKWNEIFAALLVNYEVFVSRIDDLDKHPYSLVLYVGPAVSWLNGHYYTPEAGISQKVDFNEDRLFGVVGGVDLYAAHNLSIGAAIQYYDAPTVSANIRYHF